MDKKLYRNRLLDKRLDFYLSTFGAVCVEGPKWCGKTWTSSMHAQSAFFVGSPKDNFANRQLARLDVNQALSGETPHLIDEWQEVPAIWDAVRAAVDEAARTLVRIASKFKNNPPRALAVIVGKSGLAYRREEDGVYVVPITALCA